MHVIATAGHVDHGKSTLVRALTGSDPDRLAEEHRRGLSIELGYAWTHLPPVGDVAFVDVPGHERFVSTMLSGVGPVPAVLFVVAADDPWMPQAAEHLAAIDGLGVRHGLLAVTRADLTDPEPARKQALEEIRRTSLGDVASVAVSGRTGEGIDELRQALVRLVEALPDPDPDADVRIWVDRSFHVRGAGTVVTGTLPSGTVTVGDVLVLDGSEVRVRGIECLGETVTEASGVSRVALNLAGRLPADLGRGSALLTPGAWPTSGCVDVRLTGPGRPPERPLLHVGAASVGVRARPLDDATVRLTLHSPLPLRVGDRALLRDPGSRDLWGVTVLDPEPPPLRRRGAAVRRAQELSAADGSVYDEVRRRGIVHRSSLHRVGVHPADVPAGVSVLGRDWLLLDEHATALRERLRRVVRDGSTPLDPGLPTSTAARALGLPDASLVEALVEPPLRIARGRVVEGDGQHLPAPLAQALAALRTELAGRPFAAPGADRLTELGIDHRTLAALARTGEVVRIEDRVVLLRGSDDEAVEVLHGLAQPFTTSEARTALGTSRRVALALLAHLDRRGVTTRLPDDRRTTESGGSDEPPSLRRPDEPDSP